MIWQEQSAVGCYLSKRDGANDSVATLECRCTGCAVPLITRSRYRKGQRGPQVKRTLIQENTQSRPDHLMQQYDQLSFKPCVWYVMCMMTFHDTSCILEKPGTALASSEGANRRRCNAKHSQSRWFNSPTGHAPGRSKPVEHCLSNAPSGV